MGLTFPAAAERQRFSWKAAIARLAGMQKAAVSACGTARASTSSGFGLRHRLLPARSQSAGYAVPEILAAPRSKWMIRELSKRPAPHARLAGDHQRAHGQEKSPWTGATECRAGRPPPVRGNGPSATSWPATARRRCLRCEPCMTSTAPARCRPVADPPGPGAAADG